MPEGKTKLMIKHQTGVLEDCQKVIKKFADLDKAMCANCGQEWVIGNEDEECECNFGVIYYSGLLKAISEVISLNRVISNKVKEVPIK